MIILVMQGVKHTIPFIILTIFAKNSSDEVFRFSYYWNIFTDFRL